MAEPANLAVLVIERTVEMPAFAHRDPAIRLSAPLDAPDVALAGVQASRLGRGELAFTLSADDARMLPRFAPVDARSV